MESDSIPVNGSQVQEDLKPTEAPRIDVSATTITRMMGIASVSELKLVETRIDLVTAKVTTVLAKFDKLMSTVNALPTGSDIDRLEIQLSSVKSVMKEVLEAVQGGNTGNSKGLEDAQEQSRKMRDAIKTSE